MSRLLQRVLLSACLAGVGTIGLGTTPASAHNGHIHVAGTDTFGGLALRSEPNTHSLVHRRIFDGEGDTISFLCVTQGEHVTGLLETDLWAKVWVLREDGTPQEGFISLAYTDLLQSELVDMKASWGIEGCGKAAEPPAMRRARDTPESAPYDTNFGPDHGSITAITSTSGASVSLNFSLSAQQVRNLQSMGEYLEVDFALRGYIFPLGGTEGSNGWDEYTIESNLQGAVKDVAFWDTNPYQQFPAATGIRTANILPDTDYFVTLRWDASRLQRSDTPAVNVVWTAAHWAGRSFWLPWDVRENNSCVLGQGSAPWCVFPTRGYSMIGGAETAKGSSLYPEYADGFVPIGTYPSPGQFAF